MKRVAFFITNMECGGIENYLLRFLSFYHNEIDPYIYCKSGQTGILYDDYKQINATIITLKIGFFNPFSLNKIYRELKNNNYDSVCDFTGNFSGLIMLVSYYAKIKNRITFYRNSTNHFKEDIFRLFYNKILNILVVKYASTILSNSMAAFNYFFMNRKLDNPKYKVIYNGIDAYKFLSTEDNLRNELNIPNDCFVVGHVGRFSKSKNHEMVIQTAIYLCKQYSDIYFILSGKDTDKYLDEIVRKENLSDKIKLLGNRSDIIKVFNTMNCFYFPSTTEGQPNALIEALIVGLPFVASNIAPIRECVPIEYYEQLVDINSIEQSCDKILEIYNGIKDVNLKEWAIQFYNPTVLFAKFYELL
jgi:glycosyltransferase involved in cell wall biosynthesis